MTKKKCNIFKIIIKCTQSKRKTKVLIKISQSVIHSELNQLSGHIMILAIDITSPFYNSRFNQLYVVFSAFNQQREVNILNGQRNTIKCYFTCEIQSCIYVFLFCFHQKRRSAHHQQVQVLARCATRCHERGDLNVRVYNVLSQQRTNLF